MYSYEEAFKTSLEYFGSEELPTNVWVNKYALRDEQGNLVESSPAQMHQRLAGEFYRIEQKKFKQPLSYEKILSLFDHYKYIVPQGSPSYGIGNPYQIVSLSNCFLLESPTDSYGGVLSTDEQLVQICKRRGGVGIDLSNIRPAGLPTKNSSRSCTGVIPFAERYSNSIREVGQNGRRGALMLTLDVHHPQVLDFASVKNDETKVTGANISIRLSDEFLEAVENDTEYEQRWPVNSKNPTVSKKVSAREVWKTLIHCAWLRAEPGLLFWGNVTRFTPADCYERFASKGTNPCVPKNQKVLKRNVGLVNISDIKIGDEIWSKEGWTKVVLTHNNGVQPVWEYKTTFGSIRCTENHKVFENQNKVEIQNADSIEILRGPYSTELKINVQDVMDGLVIGDGGKLTKSSVTVILYVGDDDQDYFNSEIAHLLHDARYEESKSYNITTTIKHFELPTTLERRVPERFLTANTETICGFLRGIYTANGSICADRVTLKSASFGLIQDVQLMLSSIGIESYYTTNKPSRVKFSNGEYLCKESYDLNITRDRKKFYECIGFIQKYKTEKLELLLDKKSTKRTIDKDVVSKEFITEEEVYDIEVDNESHSYWCNGFNVSNCSELNLAELDSCRLLFLNLLSYVINPFTNEAYFDYNLFEYHAKIAQRLMDDLVDLEAEKIEAILAKINSDPEGDEIKYRERRTWEKILKMNNEGRRTGTGITALGDCLAALSIKYGSDESIEVTGKIYQTLKLGCYESSVDMAEELGPFVGYSAEAEEKCPFIKNIEKERPELYNRMRKFGRRNVALLTTAPVGSKSIECQTSSGIEPVFQLSYIRRKKINPADTGTRVDFVDGVGDRWQEFKVYHPQVKRWMEVTGKINLEESPWWGCTADKIDWIQRVKLQAAAQKHVCHSISSTINLPSDVTEEKVAEIYTAAWKFGLKGITVYRDGCRSGVLVTEKSQSATASTTSAPKRPKELPCDIHHLVVKGISYYVLVGLYEGKPYEVFVGRNVNSEGEWIISKSKKVGRIVKQRRGLYRVMEDDTELMQVLSGSGDEHEESFARMVSLTLRHGVDTGFLVHQLEKTRGDLQSFAKSISRTLKKYIADGTKVYGDACQECGAELVRENGCCQCKSCGWSKC